MVLVDTSVWIELFRRDRPLHLEEVVEFDDIVTCLPVVQEVLQGFRDQQAYLAARDALLSLPMVESPMSQTVFDQAIDLYRTARRSGLTIRSSVDCLIAACALRHSLAMLHKDRDYDFLARVSPLNVRSI